MKSGTTIFLTVTLASLAAFAGLIWLSLLEMKPAFLPPEARSGKEVWQKYGCVECHTILGNGGYNGQDLTGEASRRDRLWLLDFMVNPPVMRPHRRRLHPGLNPAEAWQMIDYLEFLNRIQTPGWPPLLPGLKPGKP